MKLFTVSALALTVAATGAFAESHSGGDAAMTDDQATMQTEATVADGAASTDGAAMTEDTGMTEQTAEASDMDTDAQPKLIRTRDITGGAIYTMNEANDEGSMWDAEYTEVGADWNNIGEIEDIVLDSEGKMIGVVAEVGGFLDIGDKHVMLELADVKLVPVDDTSYAIVTRLNEEQLEQREDIDEGFWN